MLALSENGDNAAVDMLVGDIYGQDYGRLGLKSTMIASSFGKVFRKGGEKRQFRPEDISKSLLYAVSNNIGQIALVSTFSYDGNPLKANTHTHRYMNAEKYGLDRIYFGGCFIRGLTSRIRSVYLLLISDVLQGHAATIATLSYAIQFWSKGTKRAMFLRHEGFLYVNHLSLFATLWLTTGLVVISEEQSAHG
jgi:type II pantothenate kinase